MQCYSQNQNSRLVQNSRLKIIISMFWDCRLMNALNIFVNMIVFRDNWRRAHTCFEEMAARCVVYLYCGPLFVVVNFYNVAVSGEVWYLVQQKNACTPDWNRSRERSRDILVYLSSAVVPCHFSGGKRYVIVNTSITPTCVAFYSFRISQILVLFLYTVFLPEHEPNNAWSAHWLFKTWRRWFESISP